MSERTAEDYHEQIEGLVERRRYPMARRLLADALKDFPENSALLLQAAWVDYFEDRNDDSLKTVRRLLSNDPDAYSPRVLLMELLIESEKLAEAEHVAIGLIRSAPENAHLYGRYAHLMLRALNVGKAGELAKEGLRRDPDDQECLAARTLCDFVVRGGSVPSGALQKLLVEHPQSLRTLTLVIVALEERGENREAYRLAKEMLRVQPDNQTLVELVRHFRRTSHWSMIPLRPLQKYGWGASIGFWVLAVVGGRLVAKYSPAWAFAFTVTVLAYVVYSWVWPLLFRKIFDR